MVRKIIKMEDMKGWQMTFHEFNRVFESMLDKSNFRNEAYDLAEEEHIFLSGDRRYSDYDTFRNVRKRKLT